MSTSERGLKKPKKANVILNLVMLIAFLIILFPDASGINKVDPSVIGLPFFVFMEMMIALLIAVIIIVQYFLAYGKEKSK